MPCMCLCGTCCYCQTLWRRFAGIAMNYKAMYVTAVSQRGCIKFQQLAHIHTFGYVCNKILHTAAWDASIHTPISLSLRQIPWPKHKYTTATILLSLYSSTHTQMCSLSCFVLLHPPGSQHCEGGKRGREKEGREGGRPDHPALMAGLSVYIAVAHSVIHLAFWGHSLQPGRGKRQKRRGKKTLE